MSSIINRLAPVTVARSMADMAGIARAADDLGYWGVGVSDSPLLYHESYPAIAWLLGQTDRTRMGPNVTNPVSRHWTVHASTARTLEDIAPGRYFLGLAAGDGAVHSIGRSPATREELREFVEHFRAAAPSSVPVYLASSGPRMAELGGEIADGLILSMGADAVALRSLGNRGRARTDGPFETWGLVYVEAVADPTRVEERLNAAAPVAMAMSRFSLSATFESKNVPSDLQPRIRERFAAYQFSHHAEFQSENPNAHLFDTDPEVFDYLLRRFCVVGAPEECLERLGALLSDGELDGLWIVLGADDPVSTLQLLADAANQTADES